MFKSFFGVSIILSAGLFFAVSVQVAQGQEVSDADIRVLPGYKSYSTLGSFTERLRQDPTLFGALQGNEALAERILGSTMAQRQVLSKIESSGDVQQALSEFSEGADANSFSTRSAQFESRSPEKTRTSQSVSDSDGNANLAAQRAIEKAQREREAANRRANDIMARAREIMDSEQRNEALARQQEEIIASNEAVAAVMAELSDQPEALQAFLSDGALVQKVMDKEVTLSQALAEVGADINDDTASAGDAAVAENDTPVVASELETSEPAPESEPAPVFIPEEVVKTQPLPTRPPKTLPVITQPEPALSDSGQSPDSPSEPKSEPEHEPKDELVHVFGNKYRLNGKDIYDLNHIPTPNEAKLDANGWPKHLNVPEACGKAANDQVKYFFEARYSDQNRGSTVAMDRVESNYFTDFGGSPAHLALTQGEAIASPFITPRIQNSNYNIFDASLTFVPDIDTHSLNPTMPRVSISYCPSDFEGIRPEGKRKLSSDCVLDGGPSHRLVVNIGHENFPEDTEDARGCVLEQGERYFLNMSVGNKAEMQAKYRKKTFGHNVDKFTRSDGKVWGTWGFLSRTLLREYYPPYFNTCKDLNDPKPLGYDSESCGRIREDPSLANFKGRLVNTTRQMGEHTVQAQKLETSLDKSAPTLQYTCRDPFGILPPQRFTIESREDGTRRVQTLVPSFGSSGFETQTREFTKIRNTITEGFGEELYSNYVCEPDNVSAGRLSQTYRGDLFCTAKREGEVRKYTFQNMGGGTQGKPKHIAEQCQYVEHKNRFGWVAVGTRHGKNSIKNGVGYPKSFKYGADVPRSLLPPQDKCRVSSHKRGQVNAPVTVSVGEQAKVVCENKRNDFRVPDGLRHEQTLTCQKSGKGDVYPALFNEDGHNLNKLFPYPDYTHTHLLQHLHSCHFEKI